MAPKSPTQTRELHPVADTDIVSINGFNDYFGELDSAGILYDNESPTKRYEGTLNRVASEPGIEQDLPIQITVHTPSHSIEGLRPQTDAEYRAMYEAQQAGKPAPLHGEDWITLTDPEAGADDLPILDGPAREAADKLVPGNYEGYMTVMTELSDSAIAHHSVVCGIKVNQDSSFDGYREWAVEATPLPEPVKTAETIKPRPSVQQRLAAAAERFAEHDEAHVSIDGPEV